MGHLSNQFNLLYRNALLEMIADFQSERMDEQRALLPGLKRISLNNATNRPGANTGADSIPSAQQPSQLPPSSDGIGTPPDDAFLDMLMRCQVGFLLLGLKWPYAKCYPVITMYLIFHL